MQSHKNEKDSSKVTHTTLKHTLDAMYLELFDACAVRCTWTQVHRTVLDTVGCVRRLYEKI